jgi:hypothetical protein
MLEERLIPVAERPGLYRDISSGAIINKPSKAAAEANRAARERIKQRDEEIESLKSDVAEIKDLLKQLLER